MLKNVNNRKIDLIMAADELYTVAAVDFKRMWFLRQWKFPQDMTESEQIHNKVCEEILYVCFSLVFTDCVVLSALRSFRLSSRVFAVIRGTQANIKARLDSDARPLRQLR